MPKGKKEQNTKKKKDGTAAAIMEIGDFRNLPSDVVREALCEAVEKGYRKRHDLDQAKIRVAFDPSGEIKAYRIWDVVETVENPDYQLDVEEAKSITADPKVGDVLEEETEIDNFVRGDISTVKSVMLQKIKEAEKKEIIDEYSDKVGDMLDGVVESVENRFVMVRLGGTPDGKLQAGATDAIMRNADQIPSEEYTEGEHIKVCVTKVDKEAKGALVMVSRAGNDMIKRLFEKEVPEIYKGTIEIKAIARDPGLRAKMAVVSYRENIDPIGACIGPGGSRVRAISSELNGEKIDIFEWSDDLQKLVANALSPAQGVEVFKAEAAGDKLVDKNRRPGRSDRRNDDGKTLVAAVPDNQLSLAIGKKGQNARLAYRLTDHRIDIRSQSELDELGIDWRKYVDDMHEEYEEKKAAERAYKQQQRIQELKNASSQMEDITKYGGFNFEDDYDDQPLETADTLAAATASSAPAAPADNGQMEEMEEAARIAKEKRKSLAERRMQYATAVEAPEAAKPAVVAKPAKPKEEPKKEEKKPEKKKPAYHVMHPIYTDAELEEIENNEIEEELNAYNDDIDYEEYDSYYDDEY